MKFGGDTMHLVSRWHFRFLTVVIALAIGSGSAMNLWAQASYGSVFGQITDSSGAAIANATVTAKDVTKGTSVQGTTNSVGEYSVDHLIPDVYDISASAPGFKGAETKGI